MALERCTFVDNYAGKQAGAVHWGWDNPDQQYMPIAGVRDCVFTNNRAPRGGAVAVRGLRGALVLQNITAHGNLAAQV